MRNLVVLAALAGTLLAGPVMAGDAAAGKAKAGVCAACHNADGNSTVPMYPRLAGQHAMYLENALKAYRDGQRNGGNAAIMAPMAKPLSDADIGDLAAYFSQQTPK